MTSINVKISEPMEAKINDFLDTHPYYRNKREMVRDAIRHLIEDENRLSMETLKVIESGKKQVDFFRIDLKCRYGPPDFITDKESNI